MSLLDGLRLSLFTRAPHWIRAGFGGEEPRVPNNWLADIVIPTLDIGQAAGYADQGQFLSDQVTNAYVAGTIRTIIDNSDGKDGAVFMAARIIASAAAAGGVVSFALRMRGNNIPLRNRAIAAGNDFTWMDVNGVSAAERWYIPPWSQLVYAYTVAPGAGETYTLTCLSAKFPAGLNPW